MFQVLVTSGIRTGMAMSVPFQVPVKEVGVFITPPEGGAVVTTGENVVLVGEAFSPERGSAAPGDLQWSSNLQGELGTGNELNLGQLQPGKHILTLSAPGTGKRRQTARIRVEVREPKPHGHTSRTHPGHRSVDHDSGKIKNK